MQRSANRLLIPLLLVFAFTCQAAAQVPTGGVRGIVKDQSDAVIAGAIVTLTNKDTGFERKFTSRSNGEYTISSLPPGDYEVKVAKDGFKTALIPVTIQVGDNLTVDVPLEVGRASETVVITGETPTINTTDYKVDGVVTRKQIDNLPLNGRNFLQLALLEPGVSVEAVDNPGTSPNNFFRVSIAGASQALTRISVDGATINDRVTGGTSQNFSQETVQEFQNLDVQSRYFNERHRSRVSECGFAKWDERVPWFWLYLLPRSQYVRLSCVAAQSETIHRSLTR